MQTATNPETGEIAVLVGNAWRKADRIATNDKGEKAYLVGREWITESGKANLPTPEQPNQLARQTGLAARAVGPVAAGAAAGAALGAPIAGVGAIPGAVAGAGAMTLVKLFDSVSGTDYLGKVMDSIGLPRPESGQERITSDVMGAMAGIPGVAGVGQAMVNTARPVVSKIGQTLTENIGTQTAATMGGTLAASGVREAGGGPTAQFVSGLAGGVAAPMAIQSAANAVPNMVARSIQKSESTPFAREGERLARETGIDLPIGPRTGNKQMLALENSARQYAPTADRAQEVDVKIANQAIERVKALTTRISKNTDDPSILGTRVEETVKGAATRLDAVRSRLADRDYGRVREIAQGKPVVTLKNFASELEKIIAQYDGVAGSDAQKITSQARAALTKITGEVQPATAPGSIVSESGSSLVPGSSAVRGAVLKTVDEAMKTRSFYGRASRGGANVFEDIAPDMNRNLAARLFGAINRDFDESAANAGGSLRAALNNANQHYRKFSQSIEYLEKSALGKLVGDDLVDAAVSGKAISSTAGEEIIKRIAGMHPSTRQTSMDIIGRWNPVLARDLKANVLRDALDQAMAIPPSAKGASQVPISFAKFVTSIGSEKVGFERQLKSYGFTAKEVADIKDTAVAMMRAGDRTGFNYSNTNVAKDVGEIAETLGSVGASAASGSVVGATKAIGGKVITIAGKTIGFNKIVDAMATQEGRNAIKTISSAKASPQAVIAAFQTIESY
jgi:hypothetical protein